MNARTALLIIDMQEAMFTNKKKQPHDGDKLLTNIEALIKKAHEDGIPVIYIQHNALGKFKSGTPTWKIHSNLLPKEDDVIVQKTRPDSFYKTDLKDKLTDLKIQKLIVSGMQSDYCVKQTCKRATQLGYDVILVSDAHSTFRGLLSSANNIIDKTNVHFKNLIDVKTTEDIIRVR